MYAMAYSGQNDDTMRGISQKYPHTLVCLDSGTSFRNKIFSGYKPSNQELKITKRPLNIEFRSIPDLEAKDILALWRIKKKIQTPEVNSRTIARRILMGNENKGIPTILDDQERIDALVSLVDLKKTPLEVTAWLSDLLDDEHNPKTIYQNYMLTTRELWIYMSHFSGFDETYRSI